MIKGLFHVHVFVNDFPQSAPSKSKLLVLTRGVKNAYSDKRDSLKGWR